MAPDKEFIASLISTDIIVWNGVICRWGSIKEYYCSGDLVRMADDNETDLYRANYNKPTKLVNMTENLYTKNCIRTVSGIYVNVFDPKPEMFIIEDIVHALCNVPRFGGHLPEFYSVAQHSYMASILAEPEDAYEALMHDVSEAFIGDMPKPIKEHLSDYKLLENNLMTVLAEKFGFQYPISDRVKAIDRQLLEIEWECLMLGKTFAIDILPPKHIKKLFLEMYHRLRDEKTVK